MADRILDLFAWLWKWLKVLIIVALIAGVCYLGYSLYDRIQKIIPEELPKDLPDQYVPVEEQKAWLDKFCEENNITLNATQEYLINGLMNNNFRYEQEPTAPAIRPDHYCLYGDGKLYKVNTVWGHSENIWEDVFAPKVAGVAVCIAYDNEIEIATTTGEANSLCVWHGNMIDTIIEKE